MMVGLSSRLDEVWGSGHGPGGVFDNSGNDNHGTFQTWTTANVVPDGGALDFPVLVLEDQTLAISSANGLNVTVSDVDNATLTVTIEAGHGTLTLASLVGLSDLSGNGSASVTFTGSIADINAAIDGMVYAPDADYNGIDQIQYAFDDGDSVVSSILEVTVTPVNDAPVAVDLTAPTTTGLFYASFSDLNNVNLYGGGPDYEEGSIATTSDYNSPSGNPALLITAAQNLNPGDTFGGAFFDLADSLPEQIAGETYRISFLAKGVDAPGEIKVSHQDGAGDASSLHHAYTLSTDWQRFEFTATLDQAQRYLYIYQAEAADRPGYQWLMDDLTFERVGTLATTEDDAIVVAGLSVRDVDSSQLTVSLSATSTLTLSQTTGLTFTTGDGVSDSVMLFTGSVAAINAALNGLTYAPTPNHNGAGLIEYSFSDGDLSVNGEIAIDIISVNDAPTLTAIDTLASATEDTARTVTYANLAAAANEADVDGDTLSFRVEAVSSGTLTKDGNAVVPGTTLLSAGEELVWTPAANANGTLNAFTVVAWDGAAASSTPVQVQVNVTAVNDAPVATGETLNGDIAGFSYNSANGHWYKAADIGDYRTWSDARAAAILAGGYLATITSFNENQFVSGLQTSVQHIWIGASDSAQEGVWRWMDGPEAGQQFWQGVAAPSGIPIMAAYWGGGEPNDFAPGEDFAYINDSGEWLDDAASSTREYVTEVSIVQDVDSIIPAAFLLANDTDVEGQLSIHGLGAGNGSTASTAQNGTVTLLANGNIQYRSAVGFSGNDSFTYTVRDSDNAVSASVTVHFTVAAAANDTITLLATQWAGVNSIWPVPGLVDTYLG